LSPVAEVRLIATRELRRSIRSVKGIALGIITLLGAFVSALVCVSIEGSDRAGASSDAAYMELKRRAVEQATGDAGLASYVSQAPASLLAFLKITIWLTPLLIALLGFDAVAGELQHRTVRYWTIRTRRSSYFAGKLLGLWAVISLVILAINLLADGVALARGYVTMAQLASWGVRFWLVGILIAGAWSAIATFVSATSRSPVVALLTTFAVFFGLWVIGAISLVVRARRSIEAGALTAPPWYEYLYPNSYDSLLLAPETAKVLTGTVVLLGFVVVMIVAGSVLFERRDV
jgi:ABC-type transport system involved in multi-copper enzyme maturation permease subunit